MAGEHPFKPDASQSGRQLVLDLDLPAHFGRDDFLSAAPNEAALAMIEAWPQWPDPMLMLFGPPGAGKSHLATIFARRANADIVFGANLAGADIYTLSSKPALVVDEADRVGSGEAAFFHLINLMHERQASLLIVARARPEQWGLATADLLSRLRAAPAVEVGPPDEVLLQAVLVKLFFDRQLTVDASVVAYIALNLDRSLDLARRMVAWLDREALSRGRKVTRAMARELLQQFTASLLPEEGA